LGNPQKSRKNQIYFIRNSKKEKSKLSDNCPEDFEGKAECRLISSFEKILKGFFEALVKEKFLTIQGF
jgi:hypothetical protein